MLTSSKQKVACTFQSGEKNINSRTKNPQNDQGQCLAGGEMGKGGDIAFQHFTALHFFAVGVAGASSFSAACKITTTTYTAAGLKIQCYFS